jgi:apolipoprotein N-acyltransferase
MVGATLFYGAWRTRQITAISDTSIQVSVGIAQGNIDQSLKWDPAFQEATVHIYEAQTRRLANEGAQLVVWPETAAPFFFQRESPLRQRLLDLAQAAQVDILFGSPAYGLDQGPQTLFNRAYLIGPDGVALGSYDKMHLVPFGEYVPMKDLLFFVHKMVEGIGEFSSGEMAQVLPSSLGLSLGVMICFESIFPEISRTFVQNDAGVLVNLTNDAWFGDTAGPYQHLSMLTLRAVENHRWIIRAANTGISAFIDPCGRVVARIPLSQHGILVDNVPQLQVNSFYSQHGELFGQACSLWGGGLLVLSWGLSLARKRRKNVVP